MANLAPLKTYSFFDMKNSTFEKAAVYALNDTVSYAEGGVVSKQVIKSKAGNITLFAFDEGQGLSEHTAPFDALVQLIEGEAEVTIDRRPHRLTAGQVIILPAQVPHALAAITPFKMVLTMIRDQSE